MLDIVIPLGKSRTDYLDLRYTLRGIEKFTTHGDIYIIGEKPNWITGVKHIAAGDHPNKEWKERNIYLKVCMAFEHTDRFLFMNDDHILLEPVDIENYPNYYKGTCYQSMLKNASNYRQTMNQTRKWLEAHGYPDLNFDGHCPLVMGKEQFKQLAWYEWRTPFGYGMKSLYCAGLDGIYMEDGKISTQVTFKEAEARCQGRHVISCTDAAIKTGLGEYLKTILPDKSRYESR